MNEAPKGFKWVIQNEKGSVDERQQGEVARYFCVGLANHCVANSTQ
jgi:hypothetical protein